MGPISNQHVVIRRDDYVAGSRERPEVGLFTQTHANRPPVPWGRIATGEAVWMKWAGGPIVARAVVQGFRQIEGCSPIMLRKTTLGYRLHEINEYWESLPPYFYGMTIFLEKEQWLDIPIVPSARSRGESWIALDSIEKIRKWTTANLVVLDLTNRVSSHNRTRTISVSLRFQVFRRDGFACTYCGRKPPEVMLQVDHVIPFSKGGGSKIENLRTACSECNIGKGATSS